MAAIFDYDTYRDYLHHRLTEVHGTRRGSLSAAANAIGCQPGYITQILKGEANLSPEQADNLNKYLAHSREEGRFFFLLVQLDRAGTDSLKRFVAAEIEAQAKEHRGLSAKLGVKKKTAKEIQEVFFRSWYYGAIHVLVSIPEFRKPDAIARKLGLPSPIVTRVLGELCEAKLLKQEGGQYLIAEPFFHLPSDTGLIANYHAGWRLQAIRKLTHGITTEDLFYSSVVSLSRADFKKIKRMLTDALNKVREVIPDSKEQVLAVFNIDFFEI